MSSPAAELAQYLEDEGVGTFPADAAWSINVSRMPDKPDRAILLRDEAAGEPLSYELELRARTVTVTIRGDDYGVMATKFDEIFRLLCQTDEDPPSTRTIGDGRYIGIWLDSDMIDLGRDDNDRFRVAGTFRINRQPSETSS